MDFKKIGIEDIDTLRPFFETVKTNTCDYTVGGLFMWRDYYEMEYHIEDGVLFSRLYGVNHDLYYNLPFGGTGAPPIARVVDLARADGIPCRFCTVPEAYLAEFTGQGWDFRLIEQVENNDYLYLAGDFIGLAGRKYSAQRNQINKFLRAGQDWSFSGLTAGDLPEVIEFMHAYIENNQKDLASAEEEDRMTLEVLENMGRYKMQGGVLRVGSRIAGFSLGETIRDTLFVHVEKADRDLPGAYQMLVNQFARLYAGDGIAYINREEDMGDEGLRRAKLSYHPVTMLKKYIVEVL